jgi:predicted PurR-regulated permease PerM
MDDSLLNHQANQLGNTYISTLNKERNLGEDLKNNLNQSSKSLKTYNDFIQNITGQIMYIVNLKTNKKIAITSLIIAIITMIITVFTLEINLSNFIDFLKNLDF